MPRVVCDAHSTALVPVNFLLIAGARPNFMKIAPIMEAFAKRRAISNGFSYRLVHTGQHYDRKMSADFFTDLGIPEPDVNLAVGSGSHAEQTAHVMVAFEKLCLEECPDWVVVVGDVNSTLACSVTAKKLGIRVAHVEAGLRSRDMSMPEEINRVCTDVISDLLFTTDEGASENLRNEGIQAQKIEFVGNTMIDTLLRNQRRALGMSLPAGVTEKAYAVLTLHRPSNVDSPQMLERILEPIRELARHLPVVFPVHPRTRRNLDKFGLLDWRDADMRLIEPLSYLPFIGLVARSKMVLTDSGGIQEETTVLGVPCITMRETTERPITCTVGTNSLAGTDSERIRKAICLVASGNPTPNRIPDRWDGHSAERIVERLLHEDSISH